MQTIDLRSYATLKVGDWQTDPESCTPSLLRLSGPGDGVILKGPLRVRVTIQARNNLRQVSTWEELPQASDVFGYVLNIPHGQLWSYPTPDERNPNPYGDHFPGTGIGALPGSNAGFVVTIRPAGPEDCAPAYAPTAPRDPASACHCGCNPCVCKGASDALPCDFAVASHPNAGAFFPAPCEPCTPGASIGMPALKGPPLIVPPARGGTVRTRYFNGMFITREDLETDQRYERLKRSLTNRAMGQGVVWGLDVCLDGSAVCVLPGYGVDCCGNDIIVSAAYRVDTASLLRDPAAAAAFSIKKGPHRMHLLLEYFECPEQPRPVHGDPCATEAARCEMSRIRETVRLRLVPPRDVDDSGPIKLFLDEVAKLRGDPSLEPYFKETPPPAEADAIPATMVPFDIHIESLELVDEDSLGSTDLTPPIERPSVRADLNHTGEQPPYGRVRITVTPKLGYKFVDGPSIHKITHATNLDSWVKTSIKLLNNTREQIRWEDKVPSQTLTDPGTQVDILPQFGYRIPNWSAGNGTDTLSGTTEIHLTLLYYQTWKSTQRGITSKDEFSPNVLVMHVAVPPSKVEAKRPRLNPLPFPCSTEACDPEGKPRFPVMPPWLHEDRTKAGSAADPKALVLSILYAWLASETKRNNPEVKDPQLEVANAIYRAVWKMFYATQPDTEKYQLTNALQRLFQTWCRGFLYRGPVCVHEPHGVVIGCALVAGGEVQIDPWGGRRWVMHYPLLAHWGQQVGIMPIDAVASKFFDLVRCISTLPAPQLQQEQREKGVVGRNSRVPIGRAWLIFGEVKNTATITRRETLNPVDFIACVVSALGALDPMPAATVFIHYTALGVPDLHFFVPVEGDG